MLQIQIIHKEDKVLVPTKDKKTLIKFDEAGFNELLSMGIHPVLSFKQGAVFTRGRKPERHAKTENICVARVLLDCDKGEMVRYLDNDPTNLCMSNLIKMNGMSLYRARDRIDRRFPARRFELIHVYEQDAEEAA